MCFLSYVSYHNSIFADVTIISIFSRSESTSDISHHLLITIRNKMSETDENNIFTYRTILVNRLFECTSTRKRRRFINTRKASLL